jgi:hypothetical protein
MVLATVLLMKPAMKNKIKKNPYTEPEIIMDSQSFLIFTSTFNISIIEKY